LRGLPLTTRKAHLSKLMDKMKGSSAIGLVPSFDDGNALMIACMDKGVEGRVQATDYAVSLWLPAGMREGQVSGLDGAEPRSLGQAAVRIACNLSLKWA
jgi:hypothetical protein